MLFPLWVSMTLTQLRFKSVVPIVLTAVVLYVGIGITWTNITKISYRAGALVCLSCLLITWMAIHIGRHWTWHKTALDPLVILWATAFILSSFANTDVWRRIVIGLWFVGLYILL